jgi:carboxypeptidase family protein/TonB-dependent receptor-like protein
MKSLASRCAAAAALVCWLASPALAQAKAGLTGQVLDREGGVIPGATVVVTNLATSVAITTTTNSTGNWAVPALDVGTYEVTVSLESFKTVKFERVALTQGTTSNLVATLEIGPLSETLTVTAHTDVVETASTSIAPTLNAEQINNLPIVTKNMLYSVTLLPGVNASTTHQQRNTTIMGLPQSTMSITLDGVNIQDQSNHSTDGFYTYIRPQSDFIEEVQVSEATPGADSSGQGAVQMKFITRSGSNQPSGSAYEYFRGPALNTNYFFNTTEGGRVTADLPKNDITINQYGFRQGGPIVPGRSFYFVNYEEFRQPTSATRSRTVTAPLAQQGDFVYGCTASGCPQRVNVLDIAQRNGQVSALDPTMAAMMTFINRQVGVDGFIAGGPAKLGSLQFNTDRNTLNYTWQATGLQIEHRPMGRVDLNLTPNHRLTGTYIFQKVNANPDLLNSRDPTFPGAPVSGALYSFRNSGTATLRSTFSSNLVNEGGWGFLWSPVYFNGNIQAGDFKMANGFNVAFPFSTNSPFTVSTGQSRNGSTYMFRDTVSWLRGSHNISFGGSYSQATLWSVNTIVVPTVTLGLDLNLDPAAAMFTTTNLPGASATDLNNARNLYAQLTGRIIQISGTSGRNPDGSYTYNGDQRQDIHQREGGLFIQDQWHLRPQLTLNLGVRYELQFPVVPTSSVYSKNTLTDFCGQSGSGSVSAVAQQAAKMGVPCNFGAPGVFSAAGAPFVWTTGVPTSRCLGQGASGNTGSDAGTRGPCPTYTQYEAGTPGYTMRYRNLAPSVGAAWQPGIEKGWLRSVLGDPAAATVRASYGRAFNQGGMGDYTPTLSNGSGLTFNSNRNVTNNNLCPGGGLNCFPYLLSPALQANSMGAPAPCTGGQSVGCVPASGVTFPLATVFSPNGVNIFAPDYQMSYTDSIAVGVQRPIGKDMAVEVRYIGTFNHHGRETQQWAEQNIFNNQFGSSKNFLEEFQKAQVNLAVNVKNGRGATFAFNGLPGQAPLPIFLASYLGSAACGASPAAYTAANAAQFCPGAGDPSRYTGTQWTNTNNLAALSMFVPTINTFAFNGTSTTTDLFQNPTFRSNGVGAGMPINFWVMNPDVGSATLVTSVAETKYHSLQVILTRRLSAGLQVTANYVHQIQYAPLLESLYRERWDARSTLAAPHALKFVANYDVPIGRDRRFANNVAPWVNAIISNWQTNLTGRLETGRLWDLGDVRLVNMTLDDLQKVLTYYKNPADGLWYNLPQDIIINTIKAFNIDPTQPNGYAACTGSNATTCGGPDPNSRYLAPPSTLTVGANGVVSGCTRTFLGDCGTPRQQFVSAPMFTRFDFSAKKRIRFSERGTFDFELDLLNVFNAIDFNSVLTPSASIAGYQVTSAYTDPSNTFDPGGRVGQLVFRVNW